MKYFDDFVSNTYAGIGNQNIFECDAEICTGRVFYKIAVGGKYNYSLMFSNIVDCTMSEDYVSHKNFICDEWDIHSAGIARVRECDLPKEYMENDVADSLNKEISDFKAVTFNGNHFKRAAPGEFFATDPIELEFEKGDYLCLEIRFSGDMIPYHHESLMPIFRKTETGWKFDKRMPIPGMVGCDRKVKARIGFIGDSITQGIGPEPNSYKHWSALLAEKLGDEYSYWNMGLGCSRADDMASDGAWMFKAKQNDIVFICYGVNDVYNGYTADEVINNLKKIADKLKKEGKRVILQTVPPFNYPDDVRVKWEKVNDCIMTEIREKVDCVFDTVPCLRESEEKPHSAEKYGLHPNEDGSAVWAEALYEAVKGIFED